MTAEDFAAWLLAIAGMSEGQRREARAALETASVIGGVAEASAKKGGKRIRPGGRAWKDRRRARRRLGLPPLRWPPDRRLGPLERAVAVSLQELRAHVQCVDQNAHGAPAQEGALARSRARDDRGQKPGEDRGALRRPSDDGLPLASSVSARPRKRQAPKLKRNRRSGRNLPSRILQGPLVRSAARGAQTRRQGQASWPLSRQHSHPRRPRPERRRLRCDPASGRRRFSEPRPRRRRYAWQSSRRGRRQGDRCFRQQSRIPFHAVPAPEKPTPAAPHLDRRRYRKRPIPTDNAVRASNFLQKRRIHAIR